MTRWFNCLTKEVALDLECICNDPHRGIIWIWITAFVDRRSVNELQITGSEVDSHDHKWIDTIVLVAGNLKLGRITLASTFEIIDGVAMWVREGGIEDSLVILDKDISRSVKEIVDLELDGSLNSAVSLIELDVVEDVGPFQNIFGAGGSYELHGRNIG